MKYLAAKLAIVLAGCAGRRTVYFRDGKVVRYLKTFYDGPLLDKPEEW